MRLAIGITYDVVMLGILSDRMCDMNMNKYIKKLFILIIIIVLVIAVIGLIWYGIYCLTPPNKQKAEMVFKQDQHLLETIVSYLEVSDCKNLYIYKINTFDKSKIKNEKVLDAIDRLLQKGYWSIEKSGNTIFFLRWTRGKDFGAGIAYSIDPNALPRIDYLVELEPLEMNQWYYCATQ